MKKSDNKFPWKLKRFENTWVVFDDNSKFVIPYSEGIDKPNLEYIVQSANNFSKAVNLIKRIWEEEGLFWEDSTTLSSEIEEFLKSLEDE